MIDIVATPDVIPTDDITQHERTVTSVVVQWKEPIYYLAPITMYSLNVCDKITDHCTTMDINVNDIDVVANESTVRYGLFVVIKARCSNMWLFAQVL